MSVLQKRLITAMGVYAVLFAVAILTLNGIVLKATVLALALFTAKTVIAYASQK